MYIRVMQMLINLFGFLLFMSFVGPMYRAPARKPRKVVQEKKKKKFPPLQVPHLFGRQTQNFGMVGYPWTIGD